eukprot:TRINITY_DN10478_c0_g2_i2.p3 TRINITY_DN10478_c0_g2~~TRINITY_DN10478_c0_g2_i2.p3  ORF type:complete len:118 (+),score=40.30 TRINITY_DN10478_c0_g2_i2:340-693(+)
MALDRFELLEIIEEAIEAREAEQAAAEAQRVAEALANVIAKKGGKKNKRADRMNKINDSQSAVLAEQEQRLATEDVEDAQGSLRKLNVSKLNRAGDKLQKNKLTGSRSSFVKSTLKP